MFTDEAELIVSSGKGGNGITSFRREKYIPFGGPDGGDGGKGGDVIIKSKKNLITLSHIKNKSVFTAQAGRNGGRQNKTGKAGKPCIIELPIGTVIRDKYSEKVIDLNKNNSEIVIVRGGRGGKGNAHFTSSTYRSPKFSQNGEPGKEKYLYLELKIIADIGIVGLPNAGKSTLLAKLSKAKPKIADYPFTTLYPNLGVVRIGEFDSYTIADIPGLIEGAHKGSGLGIRFLKHIERTKALIFLIDLFLDNPLHQFELLEKELYSYHPDLLKKPCYIVLNKIDLFNDKNKVGEFINQYKGKTKVFSISALNNEGVEELKKKMFNLINNTKY